MKSRFLRNQSGMTLIEIMIVIAIIGGLMAVVGTKLINSQKNANIKLARTQIKQLESKLDQYYTDCNQYPTTDQGLQALFENPGSEACPNWGPNPYINKMDEIKDPFGKQLVYESDGAEYKIISYGPDRKPGGDGADKDISSGD
jgi:general secretion pathway protein G